MNWIKPSFLDPLSVEESFEALYKESPVSKVIQTTVAGLYRPKTQCERNSFCRPSFTASTITPKARIFQQLKLNPSIVAATTFQAISPQEQVISPQEELISPREQVVSLQEQVISPHKPVISPQEQVISPQEQVISPQEQVISPHEQVISPQEQLISPQVVSPQEELISPQEPLISPQEQVVSSQEQVICSPQETSTTTPQDGKVALSPTETETSLVQTEATNDECTEKTSLSRSLLEEFLLSKEQNNQEDEQFSPRVVDSEQLVDSDCEIVSSPPEDSRPNIYRDRPKDSRKNERLHSSSRSETHSDIKSSHRIHRSKRKGQTAHSRTSHTRATSSTRQSTSAETECDDKPFQRYTRSRNRGGKSKSKSSMKTREDKPQSRSDFDSESPAIRTLSGRGKTSQRSGDTKEPVALDSWIIKPMQRWICVEGHKKGAPKDDFWHSSCIVKRISSKRVATASGSTYRLVGNMPKSLCVQHGFSQQFADHFFYGFPEDWEKVVEKELSRIKGKLKTEPNSQDTADEIRAEEKSNGQLYRTPVCAEKKRHRQKHISTRNAGTKKALELSDLPTTRSGRHVVPRLAWWVGQRVFVHPRSQAIDIKQGTPNTLQGIKVLNFKQNQRAERLEKRLRKRQKHETRSEIDNDNEKCLGAGHTTDSDSEGESLRGKQNAKGAAKDIPKLKGSFSSEDNSLDLPYSQPLHNGNNGCRASQRRIQTKQGNDGSYMDTMATQTSDTMATQTTSDTMATQTTSDTIETETASDTIETQRARGTMATKKARDTMETQRARGNMATKKARDTMETQRARGTMATKKARDTMAIQTADNTADSIYFQPDATATPDPVPPIELPDSKKPKKLNLKNDLIDVMDMLNAQKQERQRQKKATEKTAVYNRSPHIDLENIMYTEKHTPKLYLNKALANQTSKATRNTRNKTQISKPGVESERQSGKRQREAAKKAMVQLESVPEDDILAFSPVVRGQGKHRDRRFKQHKSVSAGNKGTSKQLKSLPTNKNTTSDWGKQKTAQLHKAVRATSATAGNFWEVVCESVPGRTAEQCRQHYNRTLEQRKNTAIKAKPDKPKVRTVAQVTGTKGTLKRKRQIRELVQNHDEGYQDDIFDATPFKKVKKKKILLDEPEENEDFFTNFQTPAGNHFDTPRSRHLLLSERKDTTYSDMISPAVVDRNQVDQHIKRLKKGMKKPRQISDVATDRHKQTKPPLEVNPEVNPELFQPHTDSSERDSEEEEDYYFSINDG